MLRILINITLIFWFNTLIAQSVVINEIMTSNQQTFSDEDGDYPDWLEIKNTTDSVINLSGYGLSDDPALPFKWVFPEVKLFPEQYLVVFASDKDRREYKNIFWQTIIRQGDEWKYRVGDSAPPTDWYTIEFDDSEWLAGPSGFGNMDNDDATVIPPAMSVAIRKSFIIDDTSKIESIVLHVDYDDAFVAYLNGQEVARANIGSTGTPPAYNQDADNWHEARMYNGGAPETFIIDNYREFIKSGENVLALQVNNFEESTSDLTLIPFLTLGIKNPPAAGLEAPEILPLERSVLHTNFKLKSDGEWLGLTNTSGQIVDSLQVKTLPADFSFGRQPDGADSWYLFESATPGKSNTGESFSGVAGTTDFSHPAGFYNSSIELVLYAEAADAEIRYTLDGSEPDRQSLLFNNKIDIDKTTVVRSRIYETGKLPGKIVTKTYLYNSENSLPVISLTTAPNNLWDYNTGIYTMGPDAGSSNPYFGANFWKDWERPVHLEFFEEDGMLGFEADAGIKIHGGWPKAYAQKSVAIFARSEYGSGEFEYQLFPEKPIYSFEAFVLRNAGNDWKYTLFRDGMIQSLVKDCDLDLQAFRPAVVYLNGEYWGIHNIREKINEHYVEENYHIDTDSIDLMEINLDNPAAFALQGDDQNYKSLIDFLSKNDLADPANYAWAASQIDIASFIDYQIMQIFIDNKDWPGNNHKFWRPRSLGGKWRWIVFDTDYGFGLYNASAYSSNTLEWATDPDGEGGNDSHNLPFSTFIFRSLLKNPDFSRQFINRFADNLNTIFDPKVIVSKIEQFKALIEPEMPRHYAKWGSGSFDWGMSMGWNSYSQWQININRMLDFANRRRSYVREHIAGHFDLPGTTNITVNVQPAGAGKIKISTVIPDGYPWKGQYFKNLALDITALPNKGYRFSSWDGIEKKSRSVTITPQGEIILTALFTEDSSSVDNVVINEINYNSPADHDVEDWIELYNGDAETVDVSGWQFKDSDDNNIFVIPAGTVIPADDFLVLCHDSTAFKSFFGESIHPVGNFDFNISNGGEILRIYDAGGRLVDSLAFDDEEPWPVEADGNGATLELKNPELDNSIAASWGASIGYGSPGEPNGIWVKLEQDGEILMSSFKLFNNYPNPFNNTTMLSFQLPEPSQVKIRIFNIRGQQVWLTNTGKLMPGQHHVHWNASNLTSGVYFYTIEAGRYSASGKCLLIK